jgi:hypothetical protein
MRAKMSPVGLLEICRSVHTTTERPLFRTAVSGEKM